MSKILFLTTLLLATGGAIFFVSRCGLIGCRHKSVDVEALRKDGWFGAKSIKAGETIPKDSTEIRPFKLSVPESELHDLKLRLTNARYVDHIEGTKFTYGFSSKYLKQVVEYWRTKYDWKKEEAKLNAYPQFLTQIEGIDIHFIRVKPNKPAKIVLPLLVIHGWPGSVLEYYKSFPLLTEPDENGIAFEVIAPSIPGYGFSEAAHQTGFNAAAAARIFTKLMKRIGHEKFVVHGGDWGYLITKMLSVMYPENAIGAHFIGNFVGKPATASQALKTILAATVPSLLFGSENAEREYSKVFPLGEKFSYLLAETGYFHLQATKPDTIGSALVDSPVGMAAYIIEKFSTWTNPAYQEREDGGLTEKFTLDELLTNIMIYWTSGNIAASQRFYKENIGHFLEWSNLKVPVPAATVDTPHEFARAPRKLIEPYYENLIQYTELQDAGHFTAFEQPMAITKDIKSFIKKLLEQQKEEKEEKKPKKDEI